MIFNAPPPGANGAPQDDAVLAMRNALRDFKVVLRQPMGPTLRAQVLATLTDARARIDQINDRAG